MSAISNCTCPTEKQNAIECQCGAWYREVSEEQARIERNKRQRTARKAKNQAMRSMGLTRVKGALGGTYWE